MVITMSVKRARTRGVVTSKIKQYMMGIMLLLLAGFILCVINYVISTVPEVTIPPSTPKSTTELVTTVSSPSLTGYDGNVGGWYTKYSIGAPSPSSNQYYRIVITKPSSTLKQIDINDGTTVYRAVSYTTNDTHVIIDNWDKAISEITIYTSSQETVTIYVYRITTSTTQASPSISNKTILAFISWVAGIMLVITALHKLDIWI